VFPLQLIHEHRNYIGSFGLLFGICALVVNHSGVLRSGAEAGRRWGLLAVAVAYALLLASVCFGRASLWGKGIEGALIETQHHPQSASSFCELGRQYAVLADQVDDEADKEELMVFAKQGFQRCYELDDNYVHGLFALLILDARTGKPPSPERMDQLTKKLATGPFSASYATWLMILSHCQKNDSCTIGKQNMIHILQSALNNPRLEHAGLTKSVALVATADFVANNGKNYSNALELSVEAAKESPGTSFFKRNVVELAIAFGDYPTARKWIALLEQEHGWTSRSAIATLRKKLEAAEASKSGRHE